MSSRGLQRRRKVGRGRLPRTNPAANYEPLSDADADADPADPCSTGRGLYRYVPRGVGLDGRLKREYAAKLGRGGD